VVNIKDVKFAWLPKIFNLFSQPMKRLLKLYFYVKPNTLVHVNLKKANSRMLMFINLLGEVCQFSHGFEINVKFSVFGAITYIF
jgi:hypothetical protein